VAAKKNENEKKVFNINNNVSMSIVMAKHNRNTISCWLKVMALAAKCRINISNVIENR
jgi:hypothetical protein